MFKQRIKRYPYLTALILVMVFILAAAAISLSLMSPAVGNISSNIVGSLNRGAGASLGYNAPAGDVAAANTGNDLSASNSDFSQQVNPQDRVILMNATLTLTVENPEAKLEAIRALASEMGGWVVISNVSHYTDSSGQEVAQGSISIRVPAKRLDESLTRIKDGVIEVGSENLSGQDVTQQYVDMSSRLKNLEAAEKQLQTIMDSTTKVDDVLAVYNQLVSTRSEIESIKGQLQYFDQASTYSLIQVQLMPKAPGAVQSQTAGWSPLRTAESALGALVSVLRAGADVAVAAVVFFGPLAVAGLFLFVVLRTMRRITRRQQA